MAGARRGSHGWCRGHCRDPRWRSPFLIFMALLPGTFVPLLGYLAVVGAFDGAANFKITPSGQGGVTLRYEFHRYAHPERDG